jgi:hypothetical protein
MDLICKLDLLPGATVVMLTILETFQYISCFLTFLINCIFNYQLHAFQIFPIFGIPFPLNSFSRGVSYFRMSDFRLLSSEP